jgi:hypothetical protein
MKCSVCGNEKSDFAEDREFVVLDVEEYKRIVALGLGWPAGVRWEIEGWKLREAGRYRSGVCTDCAPSIQAATAAHRARLTAVGLFVLALSPVSFALWDKLPALGLIGGCFVFPIVGLCTLIGAYQTGRKGVAFDKYHRLAWEAGGGAKLHASYGFYPYQSGLGMRLTSADWEQVREAQDAERHASGWSRFVITRHVTMASDDHPSRADTLAAFKAGHMGEVMDSRPHKGR